MPKFKLPYISLQTISRLSGFVNTYSQQLPVIENAMSQLQERFASTKGLLVRSVTNAEGENKIFYPRIWQIKDSGKKRYHSLSLITKIEENGIVYEQPLLTRANCAATLHFYNDKPEIQEIYELDKDIAKYQTKILQPEDVLAARESMVAKIRARRGDAVGFDRGIGSWIPGLGFFSLNEVRASISPRQRIAYGITSAEGGNLTDIFLKKNQSISQLNAAELMTLVGNLKAVLDMFYSGIEHVKNFGEYKPYCIYSKGLLLPYQPTANDLCAFLHAANEILSHPSFLKSCIDADDNHHYCAFAFVDALQTIASAGEHSLKTTSWEFGLFGRAIYATGRYASEKVIQHIEQENIIPSPRHSRESA